MNSVLLAYFADGAARVVIFRILGDLMNASPEVIDIFDPVTQNLIKKCFGDTSELYENCVSPRGRAFQFATMLSAYRMRVKHPTATIAELINWLHESDPYEAIMMPNAMEMIASMLFYTNVLKIWPNRIMMALRHQNKIEIY